MATTTSNGLRQRTTTLLRLPSTNSSGPTQQHTHHHHHHTPQQQHQHQQIPVLNIQLQDAAALKQDLAHCKNCFSCSHCLFKPSFHAFPVGSFLSCSLAIVGMAIQHKGWHQASPTVYKYNPEAWWYIWCFAYLASCLLVLVNLSVFVHGVALFIKQGTKGRRCFGLCGRHAARNNDNGCEQCVHRCGVCCSTSGQIFVALFGTFGIWLIYLMALAVTFGGCVNVGVSWVLNQSCGTFQTLVSTYMVLANSYLTRAKEAVLSNRAKARELLHDFQNIQDLTSLFDNSALGTVVAGLTSSEVASTLPTQFGTIQGTQGTQGMQGMQHHPVPPTTAPTTVFRFLFSGAGAVSVPSIAAIDPKAMIESGIDTLEVLNVTIARVEQQVLYYGQVGQLLAEFCYDAASLYDSVIYLSIGAFVVSISQMLIFAFHVKQFTAWSYEVELIRLLDIDVEEGEEEGGGEEDDGGGGGGEQETPAVGICSDGVELMNVT
jgi:hypothetical protein